MTPVEFDSKDYQKAILGAVILDGNTKHYREDPLEELKALATTAGARIAGEIVQYRHRPDPAYFFGKGKVDEIKALAGETGADLMIFDDDLSPAQVRNLEEALKIPAVDRSGLILDIFALHAKTNESRVQVKLAQLKYLLPRLTGRWAHLERQEGAIGTRGPGETQLETDRRMVQKQISDLERKLEEIDRERETQRKNRRSLFKITLIGYTNAGKSTLLNKLTDAGVLVEDKLFATLDSTTRRLDLGQGNVALLTDTVGFISKLPAHLVASFRSTLMVIRDADLLLHVVDVSDPDFQRKIGTVNEELHQLGGSDKRMIIVFNKTDLLDDGWDREILIKRYPNSIFTSALDLNPDNGLMDKITAEFRRNEIETIVRLSGDDQRLYPEIFKYCRIIETSNEGDTIIVRFVGQKNVVDRILRKFPNLESITVV